MSDQNEIERTDATWDPIRGRTKVSPGCNHCYTETFSERFRGVKGHAFEQGLGLGLIPEKLSAPLEWKRPRSIFVNSMSDLFHEKVEDDYIVRVAEVIVQMELAGDKKEPFEAPAILRRDALPALNGDCSKSEEGFQAEIDLTEQCFLDNCGTL